MKLNESLDLSTKLMRDDKTNAFEAKKIVFKLKHESAVRIGIPSTIPEGGVIAIRAYLCCVSPQSLKLSLFLPPPHSLSSLPRYLAYLKICIIRISRPLPPRMWLESSIGQVVVGVPPATLSLSFRARSCAHYGFSLRI